MKIVLGNFKDNGDELATFLEPRIGVKPTSSGGELTIDDDSVKHGMKPQQVKTYIKRFLLKNDQRKLYKIIVEGKELTLVYLEEMEEEEEKKEDKKREEKKAKAEEKKEEEAAEAPKTKESSKGTDDEEAPKTGSQKSS
jgi:hypothetical protein